MKKRAISFALSVCLCLGLAVPGWAAGAAFSDVPAGHWAYEFVEKAAAEGWVAGVGDGVFGVNDQVTYAQFSTMLVRAYYNDDYEAYTGPTNQWYTSFCNVANDHNLYWNTSAYRDDYLSYMGTPLDRYDMAQMLYNVLEEHDLLGSFDSSVQSGIGDWDTIPANYRPAVTGVVSAGLISGMDEKGTFGGTGTMTRGQAAVVMVRLDEAVNGGGVTRPDPEPAPNPGTLKNGREATPENVIAMLKEIEKAYPTGTVWTEPWTDPNTLYNPNPVSETVHRTMLNHGIDDVYGCGGFAAMVSDLIFPEDMAMREVTDFSQVRPGDIVFNINGNGQTAHVWVALSESKMGSSYWIVTGKADGNSLDKVRWDWTIGDFFFNSDQSPSGAYTVVYTRYPD